MTGSQVKGKSFRGALRYNQEKVADGKAEVLDNSFVNTSERNIMKEVAMVRMQRPDLKKYFYHTSINFPKDENVSNELMIKIGREYLEANGFNQHQYIMFRHEDAGHPHFHILVNRIGYDGSVVTDSNDYARSEKVLRDLEKKYNLTQVIGSREAKERGMTKNEKEMMERRNAPSHKVAMQVIIGEVLESKNQMSINEFISKLGARDVQVLFNQASTGYVSGISYSYQGMVMQGSKLGNGFKWSTIKNIINYEQERDRQRIYETNARSEYTIDKLRAGNKHAETNRANTPGGTERYGKLPDKTSNPELFVYRPSFTVQIIRAAFAEADRKTERAVDGVINTVLKIPKVLPLKTLLDAHSRGNNLSAGNEPDIVDRELKEKQRKKRRGLRM
ncbi:MAG TPA: relaxase/mobilization nuclease domain-containing protein [Chryseolinea sp.]|nr:relaxase/mobilization nuclease domain-containing protein [Chryseolinea sp.]